MFTGLISQMLILTYKLKHGVALLDALGRRDGWLTGQDGVHLVVHQEAKRVVVVVVVVVVIGVLVGVVGGFAEDGGWQGEGHRCQGQGHEEQCGLHGGSNRKYCTEE